MTERRFRRFNYVEDPSQEELESIMRGDHAQARALYERYRGLVFALARSVCGPSPIAEDVVQETFLRVFRSLPSFRKGTRFGAWISTITRNTALTLSRRDSAGQVPLSETVPAPERETPHQRILELLWPLEQEEQQVVLLHYVLELTYEEMSQVLGRAPGTLRNAMSRVLRKLRESLVPEYRGADER